jgi:hypothetical protein
MESKLSKNIPDLAKGEVFSLKVVKKKSHGSHSRRRISRCIREVPLLRLAGGNKMRWSIFALITVSTALMIGSALAQGTDVPGDNNGDKIVSAEEVAAAEKLAQEGKLSADELQEIKHIHEKYPFTIIDSANRTVTIYKPVKRMIIQPTFEYEPVFILGVQDRLAAVTNTAQKCFFYMPGIE